MGGQRREARGEWLAGVLAAATYRLLEMACVEEAWWLIVVALAIPIAFTVARILAADPRSD